jgi:hypothetical protein
LAFVSLHSCFVGSASPTRVLGEVLGGLVVGVVVRGVGLSEPSSSSAVSLSSVASSAFADDGDDLADLDLVVDVGLELGDGACDRGGDLGVDLVGGDLGDGLVDFDLVADLD